MPQLGARTEPALGRQTGRRPEAGIRRAPRLGRSLLRLGGGVGLDYCWRVGAEGHDSSKSGVLNHQKTLRSMLIMSIFPENSPPTDRSTLTESLRESLDESAMGSRICPSVCQGDVSCVTAWLAPYVRGRGGARLRKTMRTHMALLVQLWLPMSFRHVREERKERIFIVRQGMPCGIGLWQVDPYERGLSRVRTCGGLVSTCHFGSHPRRI
jgi:hypothetical protein